MLMYILGDPSLPVYLDTPDQFEISAMPLSTADGFLSISLNNLSGYPVENAVVSLMSDDEMVSKGVTDSSGVFITSIDLNGVEGVDVFANKSGFIQGFKYVSVEQSSSEFTLANFNVGLTGNHNLSLGESISVSIGIKTIVRFQLSLFLESLFFGTTILACSL